jgi:hypothetical protein
MSVQSTKCPTQVLPNSSNFQRATRLMLEPKLKHLVWMNFQDKCKIKTLLNEKRCWCPKHNLFPLRSFIHHNSRTRTKIRNQEISQLPFNFLSFPESNFLAGKSGNSLMNSKFTVNSNKISLTGKSIETLLHTAPKNTIKD